MKGQYNENNYCSSMYLVSQPVPMNHGGQGATSSCIILESHAISICCFELSASIFQLRIVLQLLAASAPSEQHKNTFFSHFSSINLDL